MKVHFCVFLTALHISRILSIENSKSSYELISQGNSNHDHLEKLENIIQQPTRLKISENADILSTATAIADVINEFFVKEDIKFDIMIFGEISKKTYDLIDEICKRNISQYTINVKSDEWSYKWLNVYQSAIFFVEKQYIDYLLYYAQLKNKFPKKLKFFFYINSYEFKYVPKYLSNYNKAYSDSIPFQYFLVNQGQNLELSTFEWFSETKCNKKSYTIINNFDKILQKWQKKLKNYEKLQNFHNCLVTFWPDHGIYQNSYDGKNESFAGNIMDIISKNRNFQITEFPLEINPLITLDAEMLTEYQKLHITTTFAEESIFFMITPGELYTSYEKILLPFDEETWWYLITTFAAAFGMIFVINLLPKALRDVIFGEDVRVPANVIGTFFGIGQLKLPNNNFARIILITFIFFCLIIRTAYQGVQFDMMTKEMRKSSPQTIDDLFSWNYSVYLLTFPDSSLIPISETFLSCIDENKRSMIKPIDQKITFKDYFCTKLFDADEKFALISDQNYFNIKTFNCRKSPKKLSEEFIKIPIRIALLPNHFMFEAFEETMQRIIPAGIPQYWRKYHQWYRYERNEYTLTIDEGPQILRITDLSFGYIIWLVACGVSFGAFICELICYFTCKLRARLDLEHKRVKIRPLKLRTKRKIKVKERNTKVQQHHTTLDIEILQEIQNKTSMKIVEKAVKGGEESIQGLKLRPTNQTVFQSESNLRNIQTKNKINPKSKSA